MHSFARWLIYKAVLVLTGGRCSFLHGLLPELLIYLNNMVIVFSQATQARVNLTEVTPLMASIKSCTLSLTPLH